MELTRETTRVEYMTYLRKTYGDESRVIAQHRKLLEVMPDEEWPAHRDNLLRIRIIFGVAARRLAHDLVKERSQWNGRIV